MPEKDYTFLRSRVSNYLRRTPWFKGREDLASLFVVQLRKPDYWLVLVCTTKRSEVRLLFDGNWKKAIDFFSSPPDGFPNPEFVSFNTRRQESTLLALARDALKNAIVNMPDYLLSGHDGTTIFTDGVQVFQNPGTLKASGTLYFEHFFDEPKRKPAPVTAVFPPYSHERKAFLSRFPFIKGSERPADEFRIRIRRELHLDSFTTDVAVKREFIAEKVRLFIFGSGFLIADSRHQADALEAMNTFLAYCFFRGVDTVPVSVQDVGSITIRPDGRIDGWSWVPSTLRNTRFLHRSIEIEMLDQFIADFTQGVAAELALELRLLHLSVFHFIAGEHLQAFTLAWIVLERRVSSLWRATLATRGYSDSRLNELCNPDRYTMSVVTDMLEFVAAVKNEPAQTLHSIRKARNKASHEGTIPSRDQVAKAITLAVTYVRDTWSGLDIEPEELLGRIDISE